MFGILKNLNKIISIITRLAKKTTTTTTKLHKNNSTPKEQNKETTTTTTKVPYRLCVKKLYLYLYKCAKRI